MSSRYFGKFPIAKEGFVAVQRDHDLAGKRVGAVQIGRQPRGGKHSRPNCDGQVCKTIGWEGKVCGRIGVCR
jgi:hypothetical protein